MSFATENGALWRKYDSEWVVWCSKVSRGHTGVCLWKYIRMDWGQFSRFINFEVCSGTNIWFWWDWWCGDGAFKYAFPDQYRIAQNKEAVVVDYLLWNAKNIHWDVTYIQAIQDWEMDMLIAFLDLLYLTKIKRNAEDQICWRPTKSRLFEAKSFYRMLFAGGAQSFPWKCIWRVKIPLNVAFFTWTAAMEKSLMLDNLCRRNIIVLAICVRRLNKQLIICWYIVIMLENYDILNCSGLCQSSWFVGLLKWEVC